MLKELLVYVVPHPLNQITVVLKKIVSQYLGGINGAMQQLRRRQHKIDVAT